jgi:hypothetical protein
MRTFALTLGLFLTTTAWAGSSHHDGSQPTPEELLEKVRDHAPEKYEKLMELRRTDPDRFRQHMRKIRHSIGKWGMKDPEVREHMEKMRAATDSFREQAAAHATASAKDQADIRAALVEMADELFELRQEGRRLRVERAKAHIEELEEAIEERDKARDELIEEFVDEAVGDKLKGL